MKGIDVEGLSRTFGSLKAVDQLTFDVDEGEIFGLLGPNGAGKSTTMKMLTTLLKPTSGRAMVAGHNVERNPDQVKCSIGVVFQDFTTDQRLTGEENLQFHARLYRLPAATRNSRIKELLQLVDLLEAAARPVRTYSGGMRRRLEIARSLTHRPKVLFLDEPTTGLDAQTRHAIWAHLRHLRDTQDLTILVTTHYIEEAENCGRIAVVDHGRLAALDTPENLKRVAGMDRVVVESVRPIADELQSRYGLPVEQNGSTFSIEVADGAKLVQRILVDFRDLTGIYVRKPMLEDAYLRLTGNSIRQEEASGLDSIRQLQSELQAGNRAG